MISMKEMTVTEVARKFRQVLNEVEYQGEEIILVRNRQQVARIVPEITHQNALEAMGDLYRTLDPEAGGEWTRQIQKQRNRKSGRLTELKNPWVS